MKLFFYDQELDSVYLYNERLNVSDVLAVQIQL